MDRKNPDNKPLRIVFETPEALFNASESDSFPVVLSNLAIAEAQLVKAGKSSALTHFIAIVKQIETHYGFTFKIVEDESKT